MGVKGLLPCLQSITRSVSLERYRGLTIAVDAMSWLHKGVFACDVKALAKSQRENGSCEKATSTELKCINYTINKAQALRGKFDMEVILVIDGDSLPSKKEENAHRREERNKAFEKATSADEARDSRTARRFYAQSCSVTHKIRYELIKACKRLGLSFIVAPYEADAQMARLAHAGIVDLVVTEDSDILVYGCPRALFKVDFDTFRGQEIQLMKDLGENVTPSFRNWTHDMFVFMCIISGCDYCKGVPGVGIKLAHKIVRVHRSPSKIFGALRAAGRMTPEFEEKFWIAFRTFRHQRVFCSSKQQIEPLWPIAGSNHDVSTNEVWPFLGEHIEPGLARGIADGSLHPSKKIEWNEALKIDGSENMLTMRIHSNRNQSRCDTSNSKSNVWHSLVYGTTDTDRLHHQVDGSKNEHNNATTNDGSKRDMFSFFPQNKRSGEEYIREAGTKPASDDSKALPPLQEVYVGTDSTSPLKSKYIPPAHHKDVPVHFHEYASQLVGKAFKPISRKRRKQHTDGTKSSKYVQKIWEKCAEIKVPIQEERRSETGRDKEEETGGVSLFKKNSTGETYSERHDGGIESRMGQGVYRAAIEKYNRVGLIQQQHDTGSNFFDDNPKQDTYQCTHASVAETSGDKTDTLNHNISSHQRVNGHENWYSGDFSSDATTCEEKSRVETESRAHHFKQPQASKTYIDARPQPHFDSWHNAGPRFHPGASQNETQDDSYIYHTVQNESGEGEEREVFNLLKTTKKKHRYDASVCYTDEKIDLYSCQPSPSEYNIEDNNHDSSCQGYLNHEDPDPDISHNTTTADSYRFQTTNDEYGVEEGAEIFNLLKNGQKEAFDLSSHSYMDNVDPGLDISCNISTTDSYIFQNTNDDYGMEDGKNVFNLLRTTKKKGHNPPCQSYLDVSYDATRTGLYSCQTTHSEDAEEAEEVFNLLKTVRKQCTGSSNDNHYDMIHEELHLW